MYKPVFLLGPGRSYTTIISAMLGQHPELFGFPELNLSAAETVGEWTRIASPPDMAWMRYGLVRTIAQFMSGTQSAETITAAEGWLLGHAYMSMGELYAMLATEIAPRRMVEKSPHTLASDAHLARLARMAPDACYIHVTRHPYSACRSMMRSDWFREALRAGDPQARDFSHRTPLFDPQFHWLATHERIRRFLDTIPPERQMRLRGEEVLADPRRALAPVCEWLGIDTGEAALEAMLHPEASPFAMVGPPNAPYGNDPDFLQRPALRPFTPPRAPLSGPMPWRGDGAGLRPEVIRLARDFGYRDEQPEPAPLPRGFDGACGPLAEIRPDGDGVPVAHANMLDNSCCRLPPLLSLVHTDHHPLPATGWINFGSYSGSELIVSVFDRIEEPALLARRPDDGAELWRTPLDILPAAPATRLRWVSGLLLAQLRFADGTEARCIYAGNGAEIVCLGQDGQPIWRNRSGEAGPPRCIRLTADNCLIFATTPLDAATPAQLVKMDPLSGEIVDRFRLTGEVTLEGRRIAGGYHVYQSIVVAGDHAYVEGMFVPQTPQPRDIDARLPTTLMRFRVSGTVDGRIARAETGPAVAAPTLCHDIGTVGTRRQGGSPAAILGADGRPVIVTSGFSEAHSDVRSEYLLQALRDAGDRLEPLWRYRIAGQEDPKLVAAPAIDPETETCVAATRSHLYLFGNISQLRGTPEPDLCVPALELLAPPFRQQASAAEPSSPITLARMPGERWFVAYLGLAAWAPGTAQNYALLSALRIDVAPWGVRPLWTGSMALTEAGLPLPTARSFAQPALFGYRAGGAPRTGIAMSTMLGGVALMR